MLEFVFLTVSMLVQLQIMGRLSHRRVRESHRYRCHQQTGRLRPGYLAVRLCVHVMCSDISLLYICVSS